jgi:hypothetical protein
MLKKREKTSTIIGLADVRATWGRRLPAVIKKKKKHRKRAAAGFRAAPTIQGVMWLQSSLFRGAVTPPRRQYESFNRLQFTKILKRIIPERQKKEPTPLGKNESHLFLFFRMNLNRYTGQRSGKQGPRVQIENISRYLVYEFCFYFIHSFFFLSFLSFLLLIRWKVLNHNSFYCYTSLHWYLCSFQNFHWRAKIIARSHYQRWSGDDEDWHGSSFVTSDAHKSRVVTVSSISNAFCAIFGDSSAKYKRKKKKN